MRDAAAPVLHDRAAELAAQPVLRVRDGGRAVDRRIPDLEPDRGLPLSQLPDRAAAGALWRVGDGVRGHRRAACPRRAGDARVRQLRATSDVSPS